jgi:hypothetical protein
MRRPWTKEEIGIALAMLESGARVIEIAAALNRTRGSVDGQFLWLRSTPAKRAMKAENVRRRRCGRPTVKLDREVEGPGPVGTAGHGGGIVEVPPAVLADRDHRYSADFNLTRELMGDPLPGQSALDRRSQQHA